ncbi:MAG: RagB/SusD family nutrient uptake outer membrane protein [Bacteroidetes bacterium]|nr:RagB/SusD family nutrient uptake outer membrane protein [Bacteroidota bacterium]
MKKIFLLIQLSLSVIMGFSQTNKITLTFAGNDAQTHTILVLQSVLIRNLSAGCDTTVYGPNPSIILTNSLGIRENNPNSPGSFTLMPGGTNPFHGSTDVFIQMARKEMLKLIIADARGKNLATLTGEFPAGLHKFKITSPQAGLLILNASDGHASASKKLINITPDGVKNEIVYTGLMEKNLENAYKSGVTSRFIFRMGDVLSFSAYSIGYDNETIIASPVQSATYVFQMTSHTVEAYLKLKPMADDEGWWFLAQEITSDELCAPTRGGDWDDGGKWRNMYRHTWSNDDESVSRMWGAFWNGINTCNIALDSMRQLPQTAGMVSKMKELQVLRSFYYYLLIDNYGDAPYLTTYRNAPAMPFKTRKAAIFDSLVGTIRSALPYLKNTDLKYTATKYMGYALLAKLCLNAGVYTGTPRWDEANLYCDTVITGPYSLEQDLLAPFKTNNQNSTEIIFSIPYDENNFLGFRLHMRTLHYQHNLRFNLMVGPWNGFAIVPTFFDTYEPTDKRREGYNIYGLQYDVYGNVIQDGITHLPLDIDPYLPALNMQSPQYTMAQIRTTGARVMKYEIKLGAKENLSNDFPIFRLTDFYLMKAEAMIRLGASGDSWINPVRTRAGVSPYTGATLSDLLAERGRELYCEGLRRQDLIRFGKWESAWWEKLVHGTERRTFPIPKWATDANPNLLLP